MTAATITTTLQHWWTLAVEAFRNYKKQLTSKTFHMDSARAM